MDEEENLTTDDISIDPDSKVLSINTAEDGTVEITFGDQNDTAKVRDNPSHGDNLAEDIEEYHLGVIAQNIIEVVDQDDDTRSEWMDTYAESIKLLGLTIEKPDATLDVDGISTIRHPLLLEAVLRFQANARSELLPTDGPVKIRNDHRNLPSPMPTELMQSTALATSTEDLAEALEDDMNHFLTVTASEYYPDTDKMLFRLGLGGTSFKKVYHCPMRRRPAIDTVDVKDLIVSNDATSIETAGRITHQITMRPTTMKRMQLIGAYRKFEITPSGLLGVVNDVVDAAISRVEGKGISNYTNEDDNERLVYECYTEMDLSEYGIKEKNAPEGLPLPYKITVDVESQEVLEIRRNWRDGDDDFIARQHFVAYIFVPGLKFLGIGLMNILGNTTAAVTASWRMMLDAGMLANFPGGLISDGATRQKTVNLTSGVGQFQQVKTGGKSIRDTVMAYPFKPADPSLMTLTENITQVGQRIGGTAEINVGEGNPEAPVGTTIALIEQVTKVMDAVHKRLHAAQAKEFQLLQGLFKEDPTAFFKDGQRVYAADWDVDLAMQALEDFDLVPQADPNTSSQMQRIMKTQTLIQMATQPGAAKYFRIPKLIERACREMKLTGYEALLASPDEIAAAEAAEAAAAQKAQPAGQQMTPDKLLLAQAKAKDADTAAMQVQVDAVAQDQAHKVKLAEVQAKAMTAQASLQDQAQDRQQARELAQMNAVKEIAIHRSQQEHSVDQAAQDRAHDTFHQNNSREADLAKAGIAAILQKQANKSRQDIARENNHAKIVAASKKANINAPKKESF